MAELLPCPLCGHLNDRPGTRTKFNCRGSSCNKPLELSKDHAHLQDYTARKAADKAKADDWWHQQALIKQRKLGTDYDTAMMLVRAIHNKNNQKMRDEASFAKSFSTPSPKPQPFTNNTKPIVVMSTTSADDSDAPF